MNGSTSEGSFAFGIKPFLDPELSNTLIITFTTTTLLFTVPAFFFNILNAVVFSKQKPIDSVTICFLVLSVADLIAMFVLSAFSFFQLFSSIGVYWAKDFNAYAFTCSGVFSVMNDLANAMTTYIAIQRGLCVAMPFLTRHLFNRNKSLIIIFTCVVVIMGFWVPRGTMFRLVQMTHPNKNSSFLNMYFLPNFEVAMKLYTLSLKGVVTYTEYTIMVVCAFLIAKGMRSSMQLKSTAVQSDTTYKTPTSGAPKEENESKSKSEGDQQESSKDLKRKSGKEYLVIKQTFIVVVCHIICTTPAITAATTLNFHPAIQSQYKYQSLQFTIYTATYIVHGINALVNFFVYYSFNTKFRQSLRTMCYGANNESLHSSKSSFKN